jgi:hypothetical protein
MSTLDRTRPKDAALSVNIAQGTLDYVLSLSKKGFPKAIFEKACRFGFIGIDYYEESVPI